MEEEKKTASDAVETVPEQTQESPSQTSAVPASTEAVATVVDSSPAPVETNQAIPVEAEAKPQAEEVPVETSATEALEEAPTESAASETEEVSSSEEKKAVETEAVAKSEEAKEKIDSHLNQPRDFRRIARIIAAIAILIFFAWLINRESTKDNSADSNVNISVDGEQQNGTVNIIDEVKGDIKIEDSSVTATRPLAGYVISAYYLNTKNDPEMKDCGNVYELKRQGERKYDSNIVNTVRGLLAPLSAEEQAQGFSSAIPANTFLQYVRLDGNGNMEANFSGQIAKAAGSCAVTAIRAQITQTLMQFANVKTVTICINGNCKQDEVLQP